MNQVKNTIGNMDFIYSDDGVVAAIADGTTLKLQILKADGNNLWDAAKAVVASVTAATELGVVAAYRHELDAADNAVSEPRKGVWTLYDTDGTTVLMTDTEEFDVLLSENVYCTEAGVKALVGNTDLPSSLAVPTYIQNAADAVNGALKSVYVTPVVTAEREDQKILKLITESLAASYMIEAMSVGTEAAEDMLRTAARLHNRAMSGVRSEGTFIQPGLQDIVRGAFVLEGAQLRSSTTSTASARASATAPKARDRDGNTTMGSWFDQVYGSDL